MAVQPSKHQHRTKPGIKCTKFMGLYLYLELEEVADFEWRIALELGLEMGLRPADTVKLQLKRNLGVNMRSGAGLDYLTAEICGIGSEITLRLGVELGFEHALEKVDELHHLVSVSGRATCHDKGATWQDFTHP